MGEHYNRESSATSLAFSYLLTQEFDSCLVYFQKALLEAEALGFADDIAQTHHSIAGYYNYRVSGNYYASEEERQGFLDKAIEEINAGFACLTDTSDYGYGYVKQLLLEELSDTYYIQQQYDSCIFYGEQAIEVAKANDRFFENYMLYVHLYEACKALGDEKKAVAYADMMQAMDHPEKHMKDMVKVQEEFEKQEELQQQKTLHQQKSRRLYWYWLCCWSVCYCWSSLSIFIGATKKTKPVVFARHNANCKLNWNNSPRSNVICCNSR